MNNQQLKQLSLRIRRRDWQTMQDHVQESASEEACGFVAGIRGRSTAVFPIENVLHSPQSFLMDGRAQLEALQAIDDRGWELLAIYHSHPSGKPEPSTEDCAAHYPDTAMLIWMPEVGGWTCQAYRLDETNSVREIPVSLLLK